MIAFFIKICHYVTRCNAISRQFYMVLGFQENVLNKKKALRSYMKRFKTHTIVILTDVLLMLY